MLCRVLSAVRILAAACAATLGCILPATAATIEVAAPGPDTGLTLRSQSRAGVEISYRMTAFGLEPVEIGGQTLYSVSLPGVFLPSDAGAPDLASLSRTIALPEGATARFEITAMEQRVYSDIAIAPAPVIPRENDPGPLVYTRDAAIFTRDAQWPESPVALSATRQLRGVDVATVGITPFQYNPITRELVVYTRIDLRIDFDGGSGVFGEERLRSRHWEPILRSQLLNHDALPPVDFDRAAGRDGYEYVILCPDDPAFVAWADTLAAWRKLQGISSAVFTTSEVGTTPAQIEAWLDNAYTAWEVPPAAFLILGDYPDSGDRTPGVLAPIWDGYCASDNIYADVDGDDLPEMVHGRICARTAPELERMIGKMLSYEREPYTNLGFYDHPLIAGGWQTERWFILCCEVILGHQANVLGKHPVREYAIYSGAPGSQWSTNSNTPTVVDYFGPEGLGYIPATPEHLNDWGGNAEGINAAINDGAFMVVHRDHGLEQGWGEPDYTTNHMGGLHNEMYTFVFSLNCLTGKYNWVNECFAEALHRHAHGALGVIAASETSYSFVNDAFAWGMFDALWPGFMPDYPGDNLGEPDLRTAFAMTYGKHFLAQSSWPSNPGSKTVTYHLFHHHGDAFMTLCSEPPRDLEVYHYESCPLGSDAFAVRADAGAVIALTVEGEIVGVADATGAIQAVPTLPQTQPGELRITVTKANHRRYDVTVPIGGTAYFVNAEGTGDFPTLQAAIDAAANGVVIELADGIYTGEGNRDVDFLGRAVEVRSRSADPSACVIDCQAGPGDPHRGFLFQTGETSASRLAGVTVRGGWQAEGGALLCDNASPALFNCVFQVNAAAGDGGAVLARLGAAPSFTECDFLDNEAATGSGGAIALQSAAIELDGCLVAGNAALTGGGLHAGSGSATCRACTFHDNSGDGQLAADPGAVLEIEATIVVFGPGAAVASPVGATVSLACCDLFGNAGGDWVGEIAGQAGLNGNFSEDPLFCDAPGGLFTLSSASLCAPGSHPLCGGIGARGVGCAPPTWQVAPDGSGDFPTVQAAVDAAEPGTVIELVNGTYTGDGNRDIDLGDRRVTVRSASGNAEACVLDCEASELEPHRAFVIDGGQDARTRISALTIRNGRALTGGAILVGDACGPTLADCIFEGCVAEDDGGAVALAGASALITGCTFDGNLAGGAGGGLHAAGPGTPAVVGCTFHANAAAAGGGLMAGDDAQLTLANTIIAFGLGGGAVGCAPTGAAQLACCDLFANDGGDWTGCIEVQLGIDGNIAADPLFCNAGAGLFSLYHDSPCAYENNAECGQIGVGAIGCMHPYFIKPDGTGDFPTIQAALDAASFGMIVELDDGVFRGPGNRDLDFFGKDLTLRSRSGNAAACVIDPQGTSAQPHNAFRFHTGEDHDTVVQSITMTGGYSFFGGACFISSASPTFSGCVFHSNGANNGGAVYAYYVCTPRFVNCTFSHNTGGGATQGGIFFLNTDANVILENCLLTNSTQGVAFNIITSTPALTCCDIYGNAGGDWTAPIAPQYGVNGNVSVDPLYCDAPARNFAIDETSPCAHEQNPGCGLIGALGVGCYSSDAPESPLPAGLALAIQAPAAGRGALVRYALPGAATATVRLCIYDTAGRLVRTLIDGEQAPGRHALLWDGRCDDGARAGSGIFFCRLTHGGETRTRNLVLVR